nr:GNAT family N-acetyltransferase [Microbacterium bovistercoris]
MTDVLLTWLVVMVSVLLLFALAVGAALAVFIWRRARRRSGATHAPESVPEQPLHNGQTSEPWEFLSVSGERVKLDLLRQSDFEALYAMDSDPRQFRYEIESPLSRDEVAARLTRGVTATRLEKPGDYLYPAIRDMNGSFLGTTYLELKGDVESRTAEIGISLTRAAQGKGYAIEATQLLLDLAFVKLRLHRVYAELHVGNVASSRICEHLLMRREAHVIEGRWVKGQWIDWASYAILEREWSPVYLS